ncbi:MAG: CHASE2 domain-containing protein [Gammaproteobacteria bacterium]|nr:CHASE2 domain-containing protein [Gammaproteobacteria bacterium]MDH3411636.1 CHASE2 domain-containing protein [Gammaproteobacteria bacterium]
MTIEWTAIACTLVLLACLIAFQDWFWRVDQTLYDFGMTLMERPAPSDMVIVAIDDQSLADIGRWPWRRAVHATLINRLTEAGARAVALDVILSEPDARDPKGDLSLAKALRANGKTVLPIFMVGVAGAWREIAPIPQFRDAAAALGHIHVEIDIDGMVRSVYLREGLDSPRWDHMGVALLRLVDPLAAATLPGAVAPERKGKAGMWQRNYWLTIPFAGAPGRFAQVSYVDVLRGAIPAERLRDKIVLIGATAAGLSDAYPTPVSGLSRNMPGVEIIANVFDAVRKKLVVTIISPAVRAGVASIVVLMLMLSYLWLTPRRALGLTGALLALVLLGSVGLLVTKLEWWAPSGTIAPLLMAYPLWSWRRLQAAMRYMDEEVVRLRETPQLFPGEAPVSSMTVDPIQQRIDSVRDAAERLRSLHRLVEDTLASLPDGVLLVDGSGIVVLANPRAAMYLCADSQGHLRGQPLHSILGRIENAGDSTWEEIVHNSLQRPQISSIDGHHPVTGDLLVKIGPCVSSSGAIVGLIASLTNVFELKQAARQRDEMMRFLSHDIRAPQSSIIALLDLMQTSPEKVHPIQAFDRIGKAAHRTLTLADDFVHLARAESRAPERMPVDLAALLLDAVDELWALAETHGVQISQRFESDEAIVLGDRDMLLRALVNLLNNAIKYSPAGGGVVLGVGCASGLVKVWIEDHGPGIATEDIAKLFQMYQRGTAMGEPQSGVGLGLVYVKTVVDKHNGKVTVLSKPGHGACFTLIFPEAPVTAT